MHNVPKWSDRLKKSCSKCCKIFKVCLTFLEHYALKGKKPSWLVTVWFLRDWILIENCILFLITKYSKFTNKIRSGNFTDKFCPKYQEILKKRGILHPPHTPLGTPLQVIWTDEIPLSDCLYFLRYWAICLLQLFVNQTVTSEMKYFLSFKSRRFWGQIKKHFLLFLQCFQLPKIVWDQKVCL